MTVKTPTQRRWLRSVIAASAEPLPAFPWMRGQRNHSAQVAAPVAPQAPRQAFGLFVRKGAVAAR